VSFTIHVCSLKLACRFMRCLIMSTIRPSQSTIASQISYRYFSCFLVVLGQPRQKNPRSLSVSKRITGRIWQKYSSSKCTSIDRLDNRCDFKISIRRPRSDFVQKSVADWRINTKRLPVLFFVSLCPTVALVLTRVVNVHRSKLFCYPLLNDVIREL